MVLSHRNVLANIEQTTDMLNPVDNDVIVGCLPLFHAFGLTVTTLLPPIECIPVGSGKTDFGAARQMASATLDAA